MNEKLNTAVSQLGAYFLSTISVLEGVNWLAAITGMAGAALTGASAYKMYQDARYRKLEADKLRKEVHG